MNNNNIKTLLTPHLTTTLHQLLQSSEKTIPLSPEHTSIQTSIVELLMDIQRKSIDRTNRLLCFTLGIVELCISIIQTKPPALHLDNILEWSWIIIKQSFHRIEDNEDNENTNNTQLMKLGISIGILELSVYEISFRPLRMQGNLAGWANKCLLAIASRDIFINRIIESNVHFACLNLIHLPGNVETDPDYRENVSDAFAILNWIAFYRPDLLRDLSEINLIDTAIPWLPLLMNGNDKIKRVGFVAARMIIRIGSHAVAKVIEEYPIVIEFLQKLISQLCDLGPNRAIYGVTWNLSGVVRDVALINITNNKHLLVPIVPLMLDLVIKYGKDDYELIQHGVIFLSQVACNDESCLLSLRNDKNKIKLIQHIVQSECLFGKETLGLLDIVVREVFLIN
jgi:hypothetical protein